MSIHKEIRFEDEICAHLGEHGWLYDPGSAALYDRKRALFTPDLVEWVQETQPKVWESLSRSHGSGAEAALLDRVRKQIDDRGTLGDPVIGDSRCHGRHHRQPEGRPNLVGGVDEP